MTSYERVWRVFWAVLTACGVGLALLEWSPLGVLVTLAMVGALGWVAPYLMPDRVLPHPMTIAAVTVALWGVGSMSLPLAVLAVLVTGLTSPRVVRVVARTARRSAPPEHGSRPATADDVDEDSHLTLPEAMGPLHGLDERQLCRLWRESFWILRRPAPPGTVLCIVALREACLDELERRDSAAVHAWLDAGARASSGPDKYLPH